VASIEAIAEEYAFFRQMLAEWLPLYGGRWVLIKKTQLVGVFDTFPDAYAEGVERFGGGPFLVMRVQDQAASEQIPALSSGILNAHI
jgi:hypothetical protein